MSLKYLDDIFLKPEEHREELDQLTAICKFIARRSIFRSVDIIIKSFDDRRITLGWKISEGRKYYGNWVFLPLPISLADIVVNLYDLIPQMKKNNFHKHELLERMP